MVQHPGSQHNGENSPNVYMQGNKKDGRRLSALVMTAEDRQQEDQLVYAKRRCHQLEDLWFIYIFGLN